jgi:hypothetical protein
MNAGAFLRLAVLADHLAVTILMDLITGGVLAIMVNHGTVLARVESHRGGPLESRGLLGILDGEAVGQLLVISLGGNCSDDRESRDHDGDFRQVLH